MPDPISAIEWLAKERGTGPVPEQSVAARIETPVVTVTPLDRPSKDAVGLLPPDVTGLSPDLWAASNQATLVDLIRAEQLETLPALRDLLKVLMLAEAIPPAGGGSNDTLLQARVDMLVAMGAIEPAQALIELADPDTPALFQRWFDVALLTGSEDAACDTMRSQPALSPSHLARIFCLARGGDWAAAALTLNTRRVLGDITPAEEALMSRFLDTELYEGEPPLPRPDTVTPLAFRMHEAIGERLITSNLPLAFAHADLRTTTAWKAQLDAVERLARQGAVSENVFQGVYLARTPAASGGIWDRVSALQAFDNALSDGDVARISQTLPDAWAAMEATRTEVAFAKLYASRLAPLPLTGTAGDVAFLAGLLSPDYATIAHKAAQPDPFLLALAGAAPQDVAATGPRRMAIQQAFDDALPPAPLQTLLRDGKEGEALLRATALFQQGYEGDHGALTDALALFLAAGQEDLARRAALQLLILDRAL